MSAGAAAGGESKEHDTATATNVAADANPAADLTPPVVAMTAGATRTEAAATTQEATSSPSTAVAAAGDVASSLATLSLQKPVSADPAQPQDPFPAAARPSASAASLPSSSALAAMPVSPIVAPSPIPQDRLAEERTRQERIINEMMAMSNQPYDVCYFYLESQKWDLGSAMQLLSLMNNPGTPPPSNVSATPAGSNNSNNGISATAVSVNREDLLRQMGERTRLDRDVCFFYLDMVCWDLELAISTYSNTN